MLNAKALFVAGLMVWATLPLGATNTWVAQPRRAENVDWPIPSFAGRDFWTLLSSAWWDLPGLKDEQFVQDSGLWGVMLPFVDKENMTRTLAIKEIEIYQANLKENTASRSDFKFSAGETNTLFFHQERINDGDKQRCVFISADPRPVKERYRPARASIRATLPTNNPVNEIAIFHGSDGKARLESVEFYAVVNGKERVKMAPSRIQSDSAVLRASFTNAPATGELLIECVSVKTLIKIRPALDSLSPQLEKHCQKYPFVPEESFRLNSGHVMGLNADNFDPVSWDTFLRKYQTTYMGLCLGEWDSNLFHLLYLYTNNPVYKDLKSYIADYSNRKEAEEAVRTIWKYQRETLPGPIWGLSGQMNSTQYGLEWGGSIACMELCGGSPDFPHRSNLLFARGAARQYNKPWMLYLAYYRNMSDTNSKGKGKGPTGWWSGTDFGIPPSLGRRLLFLSYYLGTSFQTFEAQPWGQVKQEGVNGPCALTGNGKAVKDIYTWVHGANGQRGTYYAPILLLMDYLHGHFSWTRKEWKTWDTLPFEDGDYMAEHFLRAIDPFYGTSPDNPPYSANLHNSKLGDIFDVFFANPPSGSVNAKLLGKYPVVILLDDINISAELAGRLKEYVAEGGTLVINSAQCKGDLNNEQFLGLDLLPESVDEDNMKIRKVKLTGACALIATASGLPVLTKNAHGKGHVLVATPHFMLMQNKQAANPLIEKILLQLQAEVLPMKVEGDIEFLFNRMADGAWRIILLNNKGVRKLESESVETFDAAYTAEVSVTVPADVQAKELMANESLAETVKADEKVITLKVPPGDVRVLDIGNLR